jgi:2-polyprenyl-3-methyl-5-hydroxy-6-metoxy-1,4-benzoquinol methylase
MTNPPPNYRRDAPSVRTVPQARCPVCGGEEARAFASGLDYELQTCANRWTFVQCAKCATLYLDPRPDEADLSVIYPPTYYAYDLSEKLHPLIVRAKAVLDALKFRAILNAIDRKPSSYLDVGCGDGRYLKHFATAKGSRQDVHGLDLPSPSLAPLRDQGFTIHEGRVEDNDEIEADSLDVITIFHVIEHVADPQRVIRQLATWLKPGGVLALETPNIASWDARLFARSYWGGYHFPRHWTLFTPDSLRAAVRAAGLEVLAIKYQTGHSFWLYSFHHWLTYREKGANAALGDVFDPLRSKIALAAFTAFDIFRRTLGFRTSAMLLLARKPA